MAIENSEARRIPQISLPYHLAYFSMEVALESDIPTYSGGLGVLAGDMLRSAADLGAPMIGVTLLHRKGHFFQTLDAQGRQHEEPVAWSPEDFLKPTEGVCKVEIEGRQVSVRAWCYPVRGVSGHIVPVFLLDTSVTENEPYDRTLTDHLYGGDLRYRLCQEVVLGIGGVRMLRALGFSEVATFHLNEGHSALLALELFDEELKENHQDRDEAIGRVKRKCVFTTHTPVPAGHDRFPRDLARSVLGEERVHALDVLGCCADELNMSRVALNLSHYVNGVTQRHGEISRTMFPGYPIGSITNGVHSATWTSAPLQALYDRHSEHWRRDYFSLRYALSLPLDAIRRAHHEAKAQLLNDINRLFNAGFDQHAFTIGVARRATAYKRPTLVLRDPDRLRQISVRHDPLQIVFGGKAHPQDIEGKNLIEEIVRSQNALKPNLRIVYLPNYDMQLAKLVTAGVDLWLNTPMPPYEASGTSGMKAAHNGVPSLSILDGWWREGHIEGVTGWAIGPRDRPADRTDEQDAADLYQKLDETILPIFHDDPQRWAEIMRSTIALNASVFNTHRMLHEYFVKAYEEQHRTHEQTSKVFW